MSHIVTLEEAQTLTGQWKHHAYNALDVTGTREIGDELLGRMSQATARTYAFERAIRAPALTMSLRGILVDEKARTTAAKALEREVTADLKAIDTMPQLAVWDGTELETGFCPAPHPDGKPHRHKWPRGVEDSPDKTCQVCGVPRVRRAPFNANSTTQLKHLFYDILGLPPMYNKKKKIAVDKEVLDRIGQKYPKHWELASAVREVKLKKKQLGFLKGRLVNHRYHSVFNVGAAWTGRFSSSMRFGTEGGNSQNVAERHRHIFLPDPGMCIGYADLKTAESLAVSHYSGDEGYIQAHKSGDTHTYVTRLLWPDLLWTGDLKRDKAVAKQSPEWDPAPGHDYRFQAKRIQHGPLANYMKLLTKSGWKTIEEVAASPEAIAVWKEGKSWWEVPSNFVIRPHDGPLVHLEGRNVSQHVTEEHRLPHFNNGKWGEKLAAQLPLKYGRLPVSGVLEEGNVGNEIEARLLAMYWADGHKQSGKARVTLKRTRKIERLRTLLRVANIVWQEISISGDRILFQWDGFRRKCLDWDILSWSLTARLAFLEELPKWDGHINPVTGQLRIFQVNRAQLEIIQAVAHISGYSASIYKHGNPRENERQSWALGLHKNTAIDYSKTTAKRQPYSGQVYCPVTTAGFVFVQNAGRVSITGNSNFGLKPFGIAMIAHIPQKAAESAQGRYFGEFPLIPAWQRHVEADVRQQRPLVNALGRTVYLTGRPWDLHTIRQGYSFLPQSTVADVINIALWRVWKELDPQLVQILAQVHDAILFQFPKGKLTEVAEQMFRLMTIPVPITDPYGTRRTMEIEVEMAVGGNWGKRGESNQNGMVEL